MKRAPFALIALLVVTCGCHGQPNPTPPVYTCPTAGNNAYTALNDVGSANPPTTAMTYTDTPSGQSCYVVTGWLSGPGYGAWSNTVGPSAGGPTGKNGISWTCTAGTGTTCTGVKWIVSRALAVAATAPAIPAVGPVTTSQIEESKPTLAAIGKLDVKLKGM
jgi:hypothetical protein